MFKWFLDLFKTEEPKCCVDCEYCNKIDPDNFRCRSPQNLCPFKKDTVTGEFIEDSNNRYKNCKEARRLILCWHSGQPKDNCGPKGTWFKSKKADKDESNNSSS